jgi:hypothetical protein
MRNYLPSLTWNPPATLRESAPKEAHVWLLQPAFTIIKAQHHVLLSKERLEEEGISHQIMEKYKIQLFQNC